MAAWPSIRRARGTGGGGHHRVRAGMEVERWPVSPWVSRSGHGRGSPERSHRGHRTRRADKAVRANAGSRRRPWPPVSSRSARQVRPRSSSRATTSPSPPRPYASSRPVAGLDLWNPRYGRMTGPRDAALTAPARPGHRRAVAGERGGRPALYEADRPGLRTHGRAARRTLLPVRYSPPKRGCFDLPDVVVNVDPRGTDRHRRIPSRDAHLDLVGPVAVLRRGRRVFARGQRTLRLLGDAAVLGVSEPVPPR